MQAPLPPWAELWEGTPEVLDLVRDFQRAANRPGLKRRLWDDLHLELAHFLQFQYCQGNWRRRWCPRCLTRVSCTPTQCVARSNGWPHYNCLPVPCKHYFCESVVVTQPIRLPM